MIAYASSLDCVGLMARRVEDVQVALGKWRVARHRHGTWLEAGADQFSHVDSQMFCRPGTRKTQPRYETTCDSGPKRWRDSCQLVGEAVTWQGCEWAFQR